MSSQSNRYFAFLHFAPFTGHCASDYMTWQIHLVNIVYVSLSTGYIVLQSSISANWTYCKVEPQKQNNLSTEHLQGWSRLLLLKQTNERKIFCYTRMRPQLREVLTKTVIKKLPLFTKVNLRLFRMFNTKNKCFFSFDRLTQVETIMCTYIY